VSSVYCWVTSNAVASVRELWCASNLATKQSASFSTGRCFPRHSPQPNERRRTATGTFGSHTGTVRRLRPVVSRCRGEWRETARRQQRPLPAASRRCAIHFQSFDNSLIGTTPLKSPQAYSARSWSEKIKV
jgi:hypothetical protein